MHQPDAGLQTSPLTYDHSTSSLVGQSYGIFTKGTLISLYQTKPFMYFISGITI